MGAGEGEGGRTLTVLLALAANVGVGLLKLAAGLITGSSALLSEAAHSAGDCTTELLLLLALRRSRRPADREHPFGYGKERYFWSFLAALAIFVSGAAFSVYEGIHTIFGAGHSVDRLWLNYPVLGLAFVFEGISFRQAARQVRSQTRRRSQSLADFVGDPEDPTVNSVALEDSTALVGIAVAAIGVALHQLTGSAIWDGAASLVIGLLLLLVAFLLARACATLLIGKQAEPRLLRALEERLEKFEEIVDVVDLLTMMTGVRRVLVCVRADFVDSLSGGELERACARIDHDLRAEFAELDEIFVQPISRDDEPMRQRVRTRYGRALADE
ncbi:MAG: cation diffusion facilitator family transporter [Jatrophihabitantaceae bacterium]